MQTPFICSYIIPYFHTPGNIKKLQYTINTLKQDPRIQIIVVETGKNSKIKDMELKVTQCFLESNTWNVGWMFNYGVSKSSTSNLFFGTFQYIPRLDVIHNIIQNIGDRHCIYLQDSVTRLNRQQTDNKQFDISLPKDNVPFEGIYFYTKDGYIACGGYDENVFGFDLYQLQNHRNKSLLNTGQVNGISVFQVHTELPKIDNKMIEYSKSHLDKILKLEPPIVKNYIISQSRKKGSYSKYLTDDISDLIV